MKIRAQVENRKGAHRVALSTDGNISSVEVAPKVGGFGSSINGGEWLFLALATCYCNDVYREAQKAGISIESVQVEVEVEGEFGAPGEPARDVTYRARVSARDASEESVRRLLEHTDTVAEIQNTLRKGVSVSLTKVDIDLGA